MGPEPGFKQSSDKRTEKRSEPGCETTKPLVLWGRWPSHCICLRPPSLDPGPCSSFSHLSVIAMISSISTYQLCYYISFFPLKTWINIFRKETWFYHYSWKTSLICHKQSACKCKDKKNVTELYLAFDSASKSILDYLKSEISKW